MDAYIFNADIYCEECAATIKQELTETITTFPIDTGDSEDYPQGPFTDGGGETDTPNHCGGCSLFLENALTDDGVEYVREALTANDGDLDVLNQWREFYDWI